MTRHRCSSQWPTLGRPAVISWVRRSIYEETRLLLASRGLWQVRSLSRHQSPVSSSITRIMCRFSDASSDEPSTRWGDRPLKSAALPLKNRPLWTSTS
jgi:hypothetical protein